MGKTVSTPNRVGGELKTKAKMIPGSPPSAGRLPQAAATRHKTPVPGSSCRYHAQPPYYTANIVLEQ